MGIFDFLFKKKDRPGLIEIDDSGVGSLYGGIVILLTDGKNEYFREVPLRLFNIAEKNKRFLSIQKEVLKIIKTGLRRLHADKKRTKVMICQGNTFDLAVHELRKTGHMIERTKVVGRTNELAEQAFKELLEKEYGITGYDPKNYKGENLRQYAILKKRRDFKNVKRFSKGVREIEAQ